MASAVLTLGFFALLAGTGRFMAAGTILSVVMLVLALTTIILPQRRMGILAAICLIFEWICMSIGYAICCGLDESWARAVPALSLYLARTCTSRYAGNGKLSLALLPFLALGHQINDSDLVAGLWLAPSLFAPIVRTAVPIRAVRPLRGVTVLLCYIFVALVPLVWESQRKGSTIIIEGGEWADTEESGEFPSNLTQKVSYSYSSLKALLKASSGSIDSLRQEVSEAWLITPTRPFTEIELVKLKKWVFEGGHLIVVSDHTDLFGHGKVLEPVLLPFGIQTSLTAFFSSEGGPTTAPGWVSDDINVKTSNTIFSTKALPLITDRCWEEDAEYSSPNFFGPLSPSVDDRFGRRVIGCRLSARKGTVTVHADSTVMANFAVFQPGTPELLQKLRSPAIYHKIWPFLPLILLISGLLFRYTGAVETLLIGCSLLTSPIFERQGRELVWGRHIWVSGDRSLAFESDTPMVGLSTAYALLGLSEIKPRWTDSTAGIGNGLYLGEGVAPEGWRQVTASASMGEPDNGIQALAPLYDQLTKISPIKPFIPRSLDVPAGRMWTDDVMGDWWFDRGISLSRKNRFLSWTSWATGESNHNNEDLAIEGWDSSKTKDYWLVLANGTETKLTLPLLIATPGNDLYLGKGVSAEVVDQEGKVVLLGSAAWTESWGAHYSWVLVPSGEGAAKD